MLSCVINMNKTQKCVSYLFAYTIKREEKNCRWISVSGSQRYRLQQKENSDTVLHSKLQILKKFGIDAVAKNSPVLKLYPSTMDNYGMILQEGGFQKVTPDHIMRYLSISKKRISLLRAHECIAENTSVSESFLKHIPARIKIPYETSNENLQNFCDIHAHISRQFLMRKLEISCQEMNALWRRCPRLKNKSLRLLNETFNILERDIGFTKDKIRRNTFLLHSYPGNTLDTLKRIPNLGGIDIRTVLLKYPKIVMTNTNTLLEISKILTEFEIDDKAVQRCMELFTLSSENVRQRLNELKRVPEFDVYMKHPRALRLVHYIPEVRSRLRTIQGMKMQCISLHMLSSSRRIFKKYTEVGENRTRGQDLIFFLSGELNVSENFIRDKLREHPYWCRISLVAIKETLQYLKSNGYSTSDILSNVQLLLYPRNKISEELNTMMNRSEVVAAINMKKKSTISQDNCISKTQSLAMCFYFLEREHHFTGNGVWTSSPY